MNEFAENDSGHDHTANNSQENSNDPGKMFIGGERNNQTLYPGLS